MYPHSQYALAGHHDPHGRTAAPLYAQTAHGTVATGAGTHYRLTNSDNRHESGLPQMVDGPQTAAEIGPLHGLSDSPVQTSANNSTAGSVSPQHPQESADNLGRTSSSDAPVWRPY